MAHGLNHEIICPYCRYKAVYRFCLGSDWGGNPEYEKANDSPDYEGFEIAQGERPDIEIYHCRRCDHIFEETTLEPAPRSGYIPAAQIKERIGNLTEQIAFEERSYDKRCGSIKETTISATGEEMATRLPRLYRELTEQHGKLKILKELRSTLEHILKMDTIYPADTEQGRGCNE